MIIPANEVKQRGVSIFEELLTKWDEVIIAVRGKQKYVVMDIERYKELRASELDLAYKLVMEDYDNGDYETLSAKEHIEKLEKELDV
jgi:hypothetical protein